MIIIDKNAKREVQVKYPDRTRVLFPNLDDGYISSNDIVVPGVNAPISDDGVAVATINDGAEGDAISKLVIGIEPVQDLHGQNNPYPAGGGVNLLPPCSASTETKNGITLTSDGNGKYTLVGTATEGSSFNLILPVESPVLHSGQYVHVRNSQATGNATLTLSDVTSGTGRTSYFALAPINRILAMNDEYEGITIKRLNFYVAGGSVVDMTIEPSIEATNASTDFAPYSNICPINGWTQAKIYVQDEYDATADPTAVIDLNGTIYGGTLDVTTGVLTVTHGTKVFDGSEAWTIEQSDNFFTDVISDSQRTSHVQCSICPSIYASYSEGVLNCWISGSGRFNITIPTIEHTVPAIKSFFSNTPATIVYKLATPFTVQLTAQEITTLLGQNNIWADCGNVLELSYSANMNIRLQDLLDEKLDKPTTPGTLGQVLTSDGEGGQTWETPE